MSDLAIADDDILPVFCPTGQTRFEKSAKHRAGGQPVDFATPGYCAWDCFRAFCLAS
ncbi:hypothetical protein IVB12_24530 [Bradyrhizobium sp. 179]|uniref:hypothetical protein n=1 Tax=Bradyrhizobium sp. 179 TaxID=2782648 RepID=UPI001FF757EC|nr:hypothetical protein [Bradyrhizobium sp. 179]MCK1545014.1 hypothetical protein [Bradyrhizobium sp. 179]